MKKKASLSLSINAIVVLVLAITMLGLGLAFTKGMFGKLSSKLSVPEPDIPATADDPIVMPTEELSITKSEDFVFSVNFYNNNFATDKDIAGKLVCKQPSGQQPTTPSTGGTVGGDFILCATPQTVPSGEDKGFKFIATKAKSNFPFTRVCTIGFYELAEGQNCVDTTTDFPGDPATKQIVVTVQ